MLQLQLSPVWTKWTLSVSFAISQNISRGFLQLLGRHGKSSVQQLSSLVRLAWISGSYQNLCLMLLLPLKQGRDVQVLLSAMKPVKSWTKKVLRLLRYFFMRTNPKVHAYKHYTIPMSATELIFSMKYMRKCEWVIERPALKYPCTSTPPHILDSLSCNGN